MVPLAMPFREYLAFLRNFCNVPLTLNRLTLPFGFITDGEESATLLVGHVIEDLAERIPLDQLVDCLDVLHSAYELGHEQAGKVLDEAPELIDRMTRGMGSAHHMH
jgi:hypothetical protein